MTTRLYLILLFFTFTGFLNAETWYVAQNGGNDAFDGLTPEAGNNHGPFATISKAVEKLTPGDSILIRQGTYVEQVEIKSFDNSQTSIVIAAYNNEIPILTAASWDGSYALNLVDVSYILISNLTFSNSSENRKPLLLDNAHRCLISNCTFQNNSGSAAVHIFNGASNNEISLCMFTNTGNNQRVWDAHIYMNGAGENNFIRNNTFTQSETVTERGIWCSRTSYSDISGNDFSFLTGIALSVGIENEDYLKGESIPTNNRIHDNRFNNNMGICFFMTNAQDSEISSNTFNNNQGETALSVIGPQCENILIQHNSFLDNGSLSEPHSMHIAINNAGYGNKVLGNSFNSDTNNSVFEIINSFTAIHVQNTPEITINNNRIYKINYPATIDKTEYDSSWIKTPEDGGRAGHGIYVTAENPMTNVYIEENEIQNCGASAISISNIVNGSIKQNKCSGNGAWGISVNGSHNIIERNLVWGNGWMHGGCSGINIHGSSIGNIVRLNGCFSNHQGTAGEVGADWWSDGNGIIADQGADSTWIYNNICYNNEGAGIAITASQYCHVLYNTLTGNGYSEHASNKAGLTLVSTLAGSREIYSETIIGNILFNNANYQLIIADVAEHSHVMHHNFYGSGASLNNAVIHYRDEDIPTYERDFETVQDFKQYWQNKDNNDNAQGSKDGDPLFNCYNGLPGNISELYLLTTSPARNSGPALSQWFTSDYSNHGRPVTGNWDMGAYFINNLPPQSFRLMLPDNNSTVNTLTPELKWQRADDNDPGDSIHYNLLIKNITNMGTIVVDQHVDTSTVTIQTELSAGDTYQWSVTAIDLDGHETACERDFTFTIPKGTSITDNDVKQPNKFKLYQNYPNPFNSETTIQFDLPEMTMTRLTVFDIQGKQIKTIIKSPLPSGQYRFKWDGTDQNKNTASSGIYWIKLETNKQTSTQAMILLK